MGDITWRAVETLKEADVIAVEDTRVSGKLLARYGIETPMMACHEHNEKKSAVKILALLEEGKLVALISDAGTPLINDPGYRLVRQAREAGFRVVPVPGASSPIAALSASGLPTDRFTYGGFFPRGGAAKNDVLSELAGAAHTWLFLESPHRLVKTLHALAEAGLAQREICVARELTKLHESIVGGRLEEVLQYYHDHPPRGEIVLMIAPSEASGEVGDDEIAAMLGSGEFAALPPSKRAGAVARALKVPKARVYDLIERQKGNG